MATNNVVSIEEQQTEELSLKVTRENQQVAEVPVASSTGGQVVAIATGSENDDTPQALEIKMKETTSHIKTVGVQTNPDGTSIAIGMEVIVKTRTEEILIITDGMSYRAEARVMYYSVFAAYISQHMLEEAPAVYEPSTFESCVYKCCQAYTCDCKAFCNRRCLLKFSDVKSSQEGVSIKKARPIGISIIKKNVLENIYTNTPVGDCYREGLIYLNLIVNIISFVMGLITMAKHLSSDDKLQIQVTFKIIMFILSVFGLVFATIDVALNLRHNGCRKVKGCFKCLCSCKQNCENEAETADGVQSQTPDGNKEENEEPEYCKETCKRACSFKCIKLMDIARIFIVETIFYPSLLLSIFEFIVELVQNDYNPMGISNGSWLGAIKSFLAAIVLVYLLRVKVFCGTVYSIYKIRSENEEISKIIQTMLFQLTFVAYMCGQMILQILMILIIGVRFHHDYTIRGNVETSGQLWYMMICAYLTPLLGMIMFFVVHHFWTMKLPIDLIYDVLTEFQTKCKINNKKAHNENTKSVFEDLINYIDMDKLAKDYNDAYPPGMLTGLDKKILFPFTSPLHVILCMLYCGMLFGFCLCSLIDGALDDWLILYFVAGFIGTAINIYALAVVGCWISILLFVLLAILSVILLCLLVSMCSSMASSSNRPTTY